MTPVSVLLRESIHLYRTRAGLFAGYAAWLLLPYAGIVLLNLLPESEFVGLGVVILFLTQLFLAAWMWILLTFAARDAITKTPFDITSTLPKIRQSIAPMAIASLLQALVVVGGTLLFFVPGIIFFFWFFFAPVVAIFEGKRGFEALAASRELVTGRFWAVAWRITGGPIIFGGVYYSILLLLIITIALLTNTPIESFASDSPPIWSTIIASVGDVFLLPLPVIYFTHVYLDLKKTPEADRVSGV